MAGTVYPQIVRVEFQDDGSAKSAFLRTVNDMTTSAEKQFKEFSTEAQRQLTAAMTSPRTGGGALDLGAEQARAAAAAAQARAVAAREIANATRIAARENGDYSQQTRLAIAATQAQAIEEERAAKSARSHAAAVEQVQAVLTRQTSAASAAMQATRLSAVANDNGARSAGAHRAAMQQLSYQIGDVAQGFALGVNPMVIFAQQGGQVVQALGLMRGGAGGLVGFMAGPWGAAIMGGAMVLGTLIPRLFETKGAMDAVKFSSFAMGDAQGILGGVMDMTTGKINTQNAALIALARAQILVSRVQAQTRAAEARSQITASGEKQWQFGGGMGGGFSIGRERPIEGQVASQFLNGVIDADGAIQKLDTLRKAGRITDATFTELASAYANFGVEVANQKVFDQAEKLLNGQGGRELLKPERTRETRAARSGGDKGLAEFGEDAGAKLERIRDQFSSIPPAVRQANEAVRQLDDLISDLERRKPAGFSEIVEQAKQLKEVIPGAAEVAAFRELRQQSERRLEIADLIAAGRETEAAALQEIWRLEKSLPPLAEARKREIMEIVAAEEKAAEIRRKANEASAAYVDATRSARGELEGLLSGRGGNFGQIFKDLAAKATVDKFFGPAFDEIEKTLKRGTGIDSAVAQFTGGTTTAGNAALELGRAFDQARGMIAGGGTVSAPWAGAANDNAMSDADWAKFQTMYDKTLRRAVEENGDIIVARDRPNQGLQDQQPDRSTVAGTSLADFALMMGNVGVKPLVTAIAGISPALAAALGPVMGGALGGFYAGGIPGGILGGLHGIGGIGDGLKGLLKTGLDGAITGTIVSGLAKSLGMNLSTTGSQIGGALGGMAGTAVGGLLGSALGPIGAIAGGLIGKLFSKSPEGMAQIRGSGGGAGVTGTYGNKGDLRSAASAAAQALITTVEDLATRLGGTLGAFNLDIGKNGDKFVVNTNNYTGGKGDTFSFSSEEEAIKFAIADAIRDGAIQGVRAATMNILKAGKDVEKQLAKALDFENVFKRLRAHIDPVGAAIDSIDLEFNRLRKIFQEAGASAAEYASLEQLYGLERSKAVKDALEQISGSIRALLDDLTIGNTGYSLADRRAAALSKYQPLADRVKAGDATAYDDFSEAARALLEIQREMFGSQSPYFALHDEVKSITEAALSTATNLANQPATQASTSSTASGGDSAPVVSVIEAQTNALSGLLNAQLGALNQNVGTLIQQGRAVPQTAPELFPMWGVAAGNW